MKFNPTVVAFVPNREFAWLGSLGGIRGLFDGRHEFKLLPNDTGGTRFEHGEAFSGLLSFMFGSKQLENTKRGFEAMNAQLKLRAEQA